MIRTEHLSKTYASLTAVTDLNLEIAQGEFFAFLGPNGAGKTTTIKLLTGLLKPTSGRALICGHDIQTQPVEARKVISYVPDFPFLYDKLEPMEFLVFVGQLYGMERAEIIPKAEELFETFDLNGVRSQLIESLSHGTRQRVAIAAGLLHKPRVFIIDEPLVGLDPRAAHQLKEMFASTATRARRSSSRPTSWRSPRNCATASASSTRAGSSPAARWRSSGPSTRPSNRSKGSSWS